MASIRRTDRQSTCYTVDSLFNGQIIIDVSRGNVRGVSNTMAPPPCHTMPHAYPFTHLPINRQLLRPLKHLPRETAMLVRFFLDISTAIVRTLSDNQQCQPPPFTKLKAEGVMYVCRRKTKTYKHPDPKAPASTAWSADRYDH